MHLLASNISESKKVHFLTIQIPAQFDFDYQITKLDFFDHPVIKTVHI
jgi:hypothetical protein